jgi:RNA-directed DNA polymerase
MKKEIDKIAELARKGKTIEDFASILNLLMSLNNLKAFKPIEPKRLEHYSRNISEKYNHFEIEKKSGGMREISAPDPYLLFIQRQIVKLLLHSYQPTEQSHGFIHERSIVTNAELHINKKYVLNIDLADFFPSIKTKRIIFALENKPFDYSKEMAQFIARFSVCNSKLPQGAATSPILSNIVCKDLDLKLYHFAIKYKQTYTRYADDMTFSGYRRIYDQEFFKELNSIIHSEKFKIKKSKTRIQTRNRRQEVTGIVVNEKLNVNRKYIRELRAMIHYHKNGKGPDNSMAVIMGKMEFIKMVMGKKKVYKTLLRKLNS